MLEVRRSCVHNPAYQIQVTSLVLPECAPPKQNREPVLPIPAIVFFPNSTGSIHPTTVKKLSSVFNFTSVSVEPATFARSPAAAIRAAFDAAVADAQRLNLPAVALMTADTILHCDFVQRFVELLSSNSRCGKYLYSSRGGGIFALGAREWSAKGWQPIITDFQRSRSLFPGQTQCYNIGKDTFASFAVIVASTVYADIRHWLAAQPSAPLHEVMQYLVDNGHIVRAAFPNLAIQNTTHAPVFEGADLEQLHGISSQKDRETAHVWASDSYCYPLQS